MAIADGRAFVLSCLTAFFACIAGKICGMGGGVIMKPVLDSLSLFSVFNINFLSGSTVIGMSARSLIMDRQKSAASLDLQTTLPLATGAAIRVVLGKLSFQKVSRKSIGCRRVFGCFQRSSLGHGIIRNCADCGWEKVNDNTSEENVSRLFRLVMSLVMVLCLCNSWNFLVKGR